MSLRLLKILSLVAVMPFVVPETHAAPPVDLSDYSGEQKVIRRSAKPLTDKDLIFTDNIIKPEKLLHGLVLFKTEAVGRTQPKPDAKGVVRFRAEYRVRFLQYSKNKKWVAVELLNGKKRAWVPAESVEILDENFSKDTAPPSE